MGQSGRPGCEELGHSFEGSGEPVTNFKQGRALTACVFRKTGRCLQGGFLGAVQGVWRPLQVSWVHDEARGGGRVEIAGEDNLVTAQTWGGRSEGGQGWAWGSAGGTGCGVGVTEAVWSEGQVWSVWAQAQRTEQEVSIYSKEKLMPALRCPSQSVPCPLPQGPGRVMRAETPEAVLGARLSPWAQMLGH